ncbi:MAG TPA: winged helix-turn-helix domain-containing protein [Thermoplasmata archaeon]|nr:winged helix-turn-helix domain-containing protein [Thermoplasmata archaeon]
MDTETFRHAATLLSGEYSLAILRELRDGGWHLSSEVARALHIHVSTASRFLQSLAELGLVERRPRDSRTSEYRVRSTRVLLEVDLGDDSGPLREAVDFYVAYFQFLFQEIRHLGLPKIEGEMERTLVAEHQELRSMVFEQMIAGSQGGLDHLRDLMGTLHKDLWDVCSQSLGRPTARRAFETALQEAISVHPDLAIRCGLARPLVA